MNPVIQASLFPSLGPQFPHLWYDTQRLAEPSVVRSHDGCEWAWSRLIQDRLMSLVGVPGPKRETVQSARNWFVSAERADQGASSPSPTQPAPPAAQAGRAAHVSGAFQRGCRETARGGWDWPSSWCSPARCGAEPRCPQGHLGAPMTSRLFTNGRLGEGWGSDARTGPKEPFCARPRLVQRARRRREPSAEWAQGWCPGMIQPSWRSCVWRV